MDSEESVTSVGKKFTAGKNNHQHTGKCPNGQFSEPVHILMSQNFSPLIRNFHHFLTKMWDLWVRDLSFTLLLVHVNTTAL